MTRAPVGDARNASRLSRGLSALGAVLAAAAVALSAYAAHGTEGDARSSLQTAAIFAFGHGIALAALAPSATGRVARFALGGLALGTLLFSGGIVSLRLAGVQLGTAPLGGTLLIAGWLLYAVSALRRG